MIRYAHADGAAALVLQTAGRLSRGLQDERVRARHTSLEQPELPCIEPSVATHLIETGADQREMMVSVRTPDTPHALQCVLVVDVAPEGVAGIRRIGDDPALPHD